MPCQSYDSRWDDYDNDRDKIRELKKQADMLARRYREALESIAKGVHHGPRCHALARKALEGK